MADWKPQISYNYNPSYHAYAYGLVYQPGPEQNHGNVACWGDAVSDLSGYNGGVAQAYYASSASAAARPREESPPGSPEQHAANGHHHNHHHHYQPPGVVYLGDAQAGRLLLARPHRVAYDTRANGARRAGSDSTSDSEAHTSPDSWSSSSSSSREGGLPQSDPAAWTKKELDEDEDEVSGRSPVASQDVSSSLPDEPQTFTLVGNERAGDLISLHVPVTTPSKTSTAAAKAKVRATFSEGQMNALVQRFSVQRYLTPAEMKNLAEMTGLTYKQVKTWFQNRRMKLRRHQKDTSWVSERYTLNKDNPIHGNVYSNIPSHIPSGEAQPQLKEHYNQHMMEAFKKTAPQNVAFYLAAMGSAAGSAGYPPWSSSSSSSQAAVPHRPQAAGWSMPPSVGHYEYNPNTFSSPAANSTGHDMSFENKDEEPVKGQSSLNTVIVHNASQ